MNHTVFAWTSPTPPEGYPAFVNLSRDERGYMLTVRAAGDGGRQIAATVVPAEALESLMGDLAEDLYRDALDAALGVKDASAPLDMVLHCPKCGKQHIDEPETSWKEALEATGRTVPPEAEEAHARKWTNPPHRSHLCHGCGCTWRPADVPTNGVAAIKTRGKADTWPDGVTVGDHQTFSPQTPMAPREGGK